MRKEHYCVEQHITIYAIIGRDRHAFIGKTTSANFAAILSRHACGSCAATCAYFEHSGANRPKMYVLEEIYDTEAAGYKHLLAYIAVFASSGYVVLNTQRTIEQANAPHPDTAKLIARIRAVPLNDLLARGYLPKPPSGYIPRKPIQTAPEEQGLTERLSVRLAVGEKAAIDALANEFGMSQRDTIMYLVNKQATIRTFTNEWRMDILTGCTIERLHAEIERVKKENKKMLYKLKEREPRAPSEMQTQKIEAITQGVGRYFQCFDVGLDASELLPVGKYKTFVQLLPKDEQYDYPAEEGYMVFYPRFILWGQSRGPVYFVLGIGEDGKNYKLRCYHRYYYTGPSFRSKKFGRKGSSWLVGYQRAKDGAMDLYLSLPLISYSNVQVSLLSKDEKPSLASLISDAENYH